MCDRNNSLVFQEDTLSFDQQCPAIAFCERTVCLFTTGTVATDVEDEDENVVRPRCPDM
jgi:hypothetical protein